MIDHFFHREAEKEYVEAVRYYRDISPELGVRFFDEIERLIRDIGENPDRFSFFHAPIKRHFSTRFPYAVLFVKELDRLHILAIMHMKRRPGFWKNRYHQ